MSPHCLSFLAPCVCACVCVPLCVCVCVPAWVCVCVCVCVNLSQLYLSLWDSMECKPTRLLCPWNSLGKNTGVCSHSLFQGNFSIQGWNPGLLHCRQILYHLSHQGSPAPPRTSKKLYTIAEWNLRNASVCSTRARLQEERLCPLD